MNLKVAARYAIAWLQDRRQFNRRQLPRTCPICGFHGLFTAVGRPVRWNARCPACDSRERHRLVHLYYEKAGIYADKSLKILHFAPETFMIERMKDHPGYIASDPKMSYVAHREDIRAISYPDDSFDLVICHHVLEHIDDDRKAMAEMRRVLKPGGRAILSVPLNWARDESFEDAAFQSKAERAAAFGAIDHIRFYGRDFPERLRAVGFSVEMFRADEATEVKYSLGRDEAIFIATK